MTVFLSQWMQGTAGMHIDEFIQALSNGAWLAENARIIDVEDM